MDVIKCLCTTKAYFSCYFITEGKDGKSSKTPAPSVVLESLRLTLADYRKRLDNTSEEVIYITEC